MECANCRTVNEEGRKFCRQCGAALGSYCPRCKSVGPYGDDFCGVCGNALGPNSQEHLFSPTEHPDRPKQYTREEVEDLLSLRRTIREEEESSAKVTQSDVDSIFG